MIISQKAFNRRNGNKKSQKSWELQCAERFHHKYLLKTGIFVQNPVYQRWLLNLNLSKVFICPLLPSICLVFWSSLYWLTILQINYSWWNTNLELQIDKQDIYSNFNDGRSCSPTSNQNFKTIPYSTDMRLLILITLGICSLSHYHDLIFSLVTNICH